MLHPTVFSWSNNKTKINSEIYNTDIVVFEFCKTKYYLNAEMSNIFRKKNYDYSYVE